MKHAVIIVSFVASVITIGDLCVKLLRGHAYNYVTSIAWVVVIIGVQVAFTALLELDYSDSEVYVVVLFALLVPVCLAASYVNYHNLAMTGGVSVSEILLEVLKSFVFFALVVFLPLAWSYVCTVNILSSPIWLSFMFALPCLLLTGLGLSRYILHGLPLDRYFLGYVLLISSAPAMAGYFRSQSFTLKGKWRSR